MLPNTHDTYIYMDDSWDDISTYRVSNITDNEFTLKHCTKYEDEKKKDGRTLPIKECNKLKVFPFTVVGYEEYYPLIQHMLRLRDYISTLLREPTSLKVDELIELILKRKDKYNITKSSINWVLRCLIASKSIVVTGNKDQIMLSISTNLRSIENMRQFSATVATELDSLSNRVKFIIGHGPTLGTYRENLLQSCLKKHLPERYHIATGFIFGLKRQIDILIYDRVDYAPLFREGDLVIVPPESVRAVIEVKTSLDSNKLLDAMELISNTSDFDDKQPPFFKGIFAFESSVKPDTLYKNIADFYSDISGISCRGARGEIICEPFDHITCVCVNQESFAYIKYNRNKNKRLVPVLYSKKSETELKSQTSFFIQSLLSYLKFGGMKPFKVDYLDRMLGEDVNNQKIKDLREYDDSWGGYFSADEGEDEGGDKVKQMEKLIYSAQNWIEGQNNF